MRNHVQTLRAPVKQTNGRTFACKSVISRGKRDTFGNMLGMPSWILCQHRRLSPTQVRTSQPTGPPNKHEIFETGRKLLMIKIEEF